MSGDTRTAILQRILDRIEAIPVEVLEVERANKSPLWQALDDIEDMVLEHEVGGLVRRAVGLDSGSDRAGGAS